MAKHEALVLKAPRGEPATSKLPWVNAFTQEVAERICEEVAGGRLLDRISIEEAWAPSLMQMKRWMRQHPEFEEAYRLALQIRGETLGYEIVHLADNSEDHEKTKIQIGARQWLAARMSPKEFMDRKAIDATMQAKVEVATVESIDVSHLTLEEIRQAEALLYKTIEGTAIEDMREDRE